MAKNKINTTAAIGYLVCIFSMIWPGALIANRVEPFIFGLPFMFFWYTLWPCVMFIGLTLMYWLERGENA